MHSTGTKYRIRSLKFKTHMASFHFYSQESRFESTQTSYRIWKLRCLGNKSIFKNKIRGHELLGPFCSYPTYSQPPCHIQNVRLFSGRTAAQGWTSSCHGNISKRLSGNFWDALEHPGTPLHPQLQLYLPVIPKWSNTAFIQRNAASGRNMPSSVAAGPTWHRDRFRRIMFGDAKVLGCHQFRRYNDHLYTN